jgi:hypothetical protein
MRGATDFKRVQAQHQRQSRSADENFTKTLPNLPFFGIWQWDGAKGLCGNVQTSATSWKFASAEV